MDKGTYRPKTLTAGCVRAILAGRKSQLRQAVEPQPPENSIIKGIDEDLYLVWLHDRQAFRGNPCPMGKVGDLLWVREPWMASVDLDAIKEFESARRYIRYQAEGFLNGLSSKDEHTKFAWRSPREMPRWASRLTLQVTSVRVERLQGISSEDLIAEGGMWRSAWREMNPEKDRAGFAQWWNEVNAKSENSWERNPWVWVVRFRRVPEE